MKDINLFKTKNSIYLKKISKKSEIFWDDGYDGILIDSSEKEARRIIESLRSKVTRSKWQMKKRPILAILGRDDAFNRRAFESLDIDYLVSPEAMPKFDNLKQRDSGLNHVVARIAKNKGVKIIIDMGAMSQLISDLKIREKKLQATRRIARIMQNVKICRKIGCEILIGSLGQNKKSVFDEKGRKSFGVTLGMSSNEVRDCVKF